VSSDEPKGGFTIGGIGFGVGPSRPVAEVVKGDGARAVAHEADALIEVTGMIPPMRVLVVGDFVPDRDYNAGILAPEHPIRLAAGEVDALFATLKPRLSIEIESVLADGARTRVDVPVGSLAALRPDALCRDVVPLRKLLEGRAVLEDLRTGAASVEAVAAELSRRWDGSPLVARVLGGVEVPASKVERVMPRVAPRADDAADRILGMLDLEVAPPSRGIDDEPRVAPEPAKTGRFDAFLAAVAHSGKGQPGARPDEAIRILERALAVELAQILQHPEVRRLEEAYRGLALLVGRMPKQGVHVEVLSCLRDEAPSALARVASETGEDEPPVTLAIVDHEVGRDAASLAWLREVAGVAEANALFVVTNAAPALLGVELSELDRLDYPQSLFEAPASAPWRAEANRPSALWCGLALNRVFARGPYDARSSRVREATVVEAASAGEGEVWLRPAYAIGALAVKSHARFGWPAGVTGTREGGLLENLPVRELTRSNGERVAVPTEAFLSTETQRALARIGITALAAQPNSDSAYLATATTAYVPPPKRTYEGASSGEAERLPQTSLTDQLFVARLAQSLEWLGRHVSRAGHGVDVRRSFEVGLGELFENAPPPGPELSLAVEERAVVVTVRPRRFLGVSLEEVTLRAPVG